MRKAYKTKHPNYIKSMEDLLEYNNKIPTIISPISVVQTTYQTITKQASYLNTTSNNYQKKNHKLMACFSADKSPLIQKIIVTLPNIKRIFLMKNQFEKKKNDDKIQSNFISLKKVNGLSQLFENNKTNGLISNKTKDIVTRSVKSIRRKEYSNMIYKKKRIPIIEIITIQRYFRLHRKRLRLSKIRLIQRKIRLMIRMKKKRLLLRKALIFQLLINDFFYNHSLDFMKTLTQSKRYIKRFMNVLKKIPIKKNEQWIMSIERNEDNCLLGIEKKKEEWITMIDKKEENSIMIINKKKKKIKIKEDPKNNWVIQNDNTNSVMIGKNNKKMAIPKESIDLKKSIHKENMYKNDDLDNANNKKSNEDIPNISYREENSFNQYKPLEDIKIIVLNDNNTHESISNEDSNNEEEENDIYSSKERNIQYNGINIMEKQKDWIIEKRINLFFERNKGDWTIDKKDNIIINKTEKIFIAIIDKKEENSLMIIDKKKNRDWSIAKKEEYIKNKQTGIFIDQIQQNAISFNIECIPVEKTELSNLNIIFNLKDQSAESITAAKTIGGLKGYPRHKTEINSTLFKKRRRNVSEVNFFKVELANNYSIIPISHTRSYSVNTISSIISIKKNNAWTYYTRQVYQRRNNQIDSITYIQNYYRKHRFIKKYCRIQGLKVNQTIKAIETLVKKLIVIKGKSFMKSMKSLLIHKHYFLESNTKATENRTTERKESSGKLSLTKNDMNKELNIIDQSSQWNNTVNNIKNQIMNDSLNSTSKLYSNNISLDDNTIEQDDYDIIGN